MKHEICNLFVMIINYWFSIWFTKDNFEIFLFFTISNNSVSIGNCEFFQEQSGTNKRGIKRKGFLFIKKKQFFFTRGKKTVVKNTSTVTIINLSVNFFLNNKFVGQLVFLNLFIYSRWIDISE
jgi:hypothetical protein